MAEVNAIEANAIEYEVEDTAARADIAALTAALDATNDDLESTQADLATTNSNLATTNANLSTTNANLARTQADLDTAEAAIAAIPIVGKHHIHTTASNAQAYIRISDYPNLIAVVCQTYTIKATIHGQANGYWIIYFQDMQGNPKATQDGEYIDFDFYAI